jgi:hypothetical protein
MVHGSHGRLPTSHRGRLQSLQPAGDHSVVQRQTMPAEAAQARLFEDILRSEIAEMLNGPPQSRAQMRARIAEVDGLIQALRLRFPHGPRPATSLTPGLPSPADRAPRALLN